MRPSAVVTYTALVDKVISALLAGGLSSASAQDKAEHDRATVCELHDRAEDFVAHPKKNLLKVLNVSPVDKLARVSPSRPARLDSNAFSLGPRIH